MPGVLFFPHTVRKTVDVLIAANCENFSTCPYVGLIVIVKDLTRLRRLMVICPKPKHVNISMVQPLKLLSS